MKNKKILVVMGGTSSEKEISIKSGSAVYAALVRKNYNVEKFILNDNNVSEIISKHPDLCVLCLHGKGGEDGTIQGLLDLAGIKYTGSGVASSAMCINKILTKRMLDYKNIPTPKFAEIKKGENVEKFAQKMVNDFEFPLVVKAPCQGSSVGIKIVDSYGELVEAINNNINYDGEILVESFIKGTELTIPVMKENGENVVFPIIEIISENSFYDFESKYTVGMSHHIIPARINDKTAKEIEKYAKEAYEALGCLGMARVDFFADESGNPYVIEINTIPGMTDTSLVPDSARAQGVEFDDLVERIVAEALN